MIGFIGVGNMASAILKGALNTHYLKPEEVMIYDINPQQIERLTSEYSVNVAKNIEALITNSQIILIGIKPYQIEDLISQYQHHLKDKAIISIALGYDFKKYNTLLDASTRHLFVMPNTPCLVGAGMCLFEACHSLNQEEFEFAKGLFLSIGEIETLPSELMNIGGCLSGCSPAFIYMLIEAMAEAGIQHGLSHELAYKLSSQTVLGAGKMQVETQLHPGILKDQVCSPGGSTILGVNTLEEEHFKSAMIKAINASYHH